MRRRLDKFPLGERPGAPVASHHRELLLTLRHGSRSKTKLKWLFSTLRGEPEPEPADDMKVLRGITQFDIYVKQPNFHFVEPFMMLHGSIPEDYRRNYFNLRYFSPTHIRFFAEYISSKYIYHHKCWFFAPDIRAAFVSDPIDPDILNPGDHN